MLVFDAPDEMPTTRAVYTISLPNDERVRQAFLSVFYQLCDEWRWVQHGDLTPREVVDDLLANVDTSFVED